MSVPLLLLKPRTFSPLQLPGLKLWLDASRITGLNDGDPVATWSDLSGNGNHATQATGAKQPTWRTGIVNGRPVVRFDGVDDVLATAQFTDLAQPTTVFMAGQQLALSGGGSNVKFYDGFDATHRMFLQDNAGTSYQIAAGGTAFGGGTPDATSWHVFSAVFNGAASSLRKDGASVATGDGGAHALAGVTIGQRIAGSGNPINADILSVVVCNGTVLSASLVSKVERYLGALAAVAVA